MLTAEKTLEFSSSSLWNACLGSIQEKVGSSAFETWFRTTDITLGSDGAVSIQVPNQFFADFIEEHFGKLVLSVLAENDCDVGSLNFVPTEKDWNVVAPLSQTLMDARERSVPPSVEHRQPFHPNYTFGTFVVGDSNRMAHAASLAVAEAPGKTSFNPLVIYGGTGLGKTHLLQAIGRFAQKEETAEHVMYLTSEEFTRQYIDYVVHKRDSTSFYRKFSNVDLLLIDDIQFFSGKPGTQKEFYRIFNRLLHENKQIVLTSDRSPDLIPDMMEHIINRFQGGLLADIQPPNLETRVAILAKKAESDGYCIPSEVMTRIASHITSNVRELEGILIKLIAHSSFTGRDITIETVEQICSDLSVHGTQVLTVQAIQERVAGAFGLSASQLSAHSRRRDVTQPRAIAMYLCKKLTKQSLSTIGAHFGGRDYSTIVHACKRIESDLERDDQLRARVSDIEATLES